MGREGGEGDRGGEGRGGSGGERRGGQGRAGQAGQGRQGRGGQGWAEYCRAGEGRGQGRAGEGGMTVIHILIGMFNSNPMIPQYLYY